MKKIPFGRWSVEVYDTLSYFMEGYDTDEIITISRSIFTLYNTPIRKYHSAYHPVFMLEYANENGINLSQSQKLAIVFHDAVYVPGNKDNEELSAKYMMCMISPYTKGKKKKYLEESYNIILDTKQHFEKKPKIRSYSEVVLDLDIINMSLPMTKFKRWNAAVEAEFSPFMNEESRLGFLEFFLSKDNILHSKELKHLEEDIRENLSILIEECSQVGS